jgi:hypothetical protein
MWHVKSGLCSELLFLLVSWVGVSLGPLSTSATNLSIVSAPDDMIMEQLVE